MIAYTEVQMDVDIELPPVMGHVSAHEAAAKLRGLGEPLLANRVDSKSTFSFALHASLNAISIPAEGRDL